MDHQSGQLAAGRSRPRGGSWTAAVVLWCVLAVAGFSAARAQEPALLPAGAQFLTAPEAVPVRVLSGLDAVAEHAGTVVLMAVAPRGDDVLAAVRSPEGTWTNVIVDDGRRNKAPKGFPIAYEGYLPTAIAAGPTGFVAVGTASWRYCPGAGCSFGEDATIQSLIWSSADGRTWQRFDPRTILGQRTSIVLQAVTALPGGGWMIAGSTAPVDHRDESRLVVLTSVDGVRWARAAMIGGSRSLEALKLDVVGDSVLLSGLELVCSRESSHHSITAAPYGDTTGLAKKEQLRLWRSDTSGAHWEKVSASVPAVLEAPPMSSIRKRDCADFGFETTARINGSGALVGTADDRLVAMSGDGTRVAVTSDLDRWIVAELPGALPGDDTADRRRQAAMTVTVDSTGALVLLSVEARRDPAHDDSAMGQGHQTIAWRSADDGATWERLPATRPFLLGPANGLAPSRATAVFRPLRDGRMLLLDQLVDGTVTARIGDPGAFHRWEDCDPGPSADCAFATITPGQPAADLTHIDLTGATVRGGDWEGVDLRGASLRGAAIAASLAGADLRDVSAAGAYLQGDLTGAILTGADLRGAQLDIALLATDTTGIQMTGVIWSVPPQLPAGVSLDGRDLTGAQFYRSSAEPGDLRDVDFGGALLDGATFVGVDLTGAKLKRARFESLSFYDVTCPDGKPTSADAYGSAACRIKAR